MDQRARQEADFFRTVSNEGDFRLSIPLTAKALERTNLVILFTCSAGRLDSNPYSERPVGLPFEILDQGCRTVIASPYPIEVTLTRVWLPAFLEEFFRGGTAADANFAANKKVAVAPNHNPIFSLAMNVFGNPDLTHTQ